MEHVPNSPPTRFDPFGQIEAPRPKVDSVIPAPQQPLAPPETGKTKYHGKKFKLTKKISLFSHD